VRVFLEELGRWARKTPISSEEIGVSPEEIHKSLREICISFPDLYISSGETPISFFRPSLTGLLL